MRYNIMNWNKFTNLPNSIRNSLIEEFFWKAAVVTIARSISTILIRTRSKHFEISSVCNSKRSSASSMLQGIMSSWFDTTTSLSVAATTPIELIKIETIQSYYHCNGEMSNFLVIFHDWKFLCGFLHLNYLFLTSNLKVTNPYYVNPLYVHCLTAYVWYKHFTCVL